MIQSRYPERYLSIDDTFVQLRRYRFALIVRRGARFDTRGGAWDGAGHFGSAWRAADVWRHGDLKVRGGHGLTGISDEPTARNGAIRS